MGALNYLKRQFEFLDLLTESSNEWNHRHLSIHVANSFLANDGGVLEFPAQNYFFCLLDVDALSFNVSAILDSLLCDLLGLVLVLAQMVEVEFGDQVCLLDGERCPEYD